MICHYYRVYGSALFTSLYSGVDDTVYTITINVLALNV